MRRPEFWILHIETYGRSSGDSAIEGNIRRETNFVSLGLPRDLESSVDAQKRTYL